MEMNITRKTATMDLTQLVAKGMFETVLKLVNTLSSKELDSEKFSPRAMFKFLNLIGLRFPGTN